LEGAHRRSRPRGRHRSLRRLRAGRDPDGAARHHARRRRCRSAQARRPVIEEVNLGFLSALGEEVCAAIERVVAFGKATPQDGYEVFRRALQCEPSPKQLAALSEKELGKLRDTCRSYLKAKKLTVRHMRDWVEATLRRWPASK